ncbi:electron transfer flavoprotein subunit alpha/FixB family protein [Jatrophihabitans telluris]|uniref:Electron transfer flavoprotein subunit alpha/FixB family protein n=1 Tax=Jatrophihabitans telluris TaxID=2038343 RepID=A0ABY4R1X7_9ACTN|nr:electron transfer flavoprotein subunit alpha/FixB family protein [Jatrophihabitans telluris]UQX89921.1 electron transfer flavoprotein subunit alpha/FixB family protein [Jatrophihabitans telluris]
MAEVLVLVDSANGTVKKSTLELLTAARSLGEPSAVVLGAPGTAAALKATLAEYGAAKVYVAESEDVDAYLVAPKAELLAQIAAQAGPAAILVSSSPENKEIAARTAFKLDSGFLADAVELGEGGSAKQSIFGGSVTVTSVVAKGIPVISLRANSVSAAASPAAAEEVAVDVAISDVAKGAKVLEWVEEAKGSRPSLQDASVIVSGGRGVGSAENFKIVEEVADSIGAAVGASRAATDAGWVPHTMQVGQTGVTVAPQLYIALGISGAIQHRAGMQTSKTIVAVNKDPEAPIFELADFGVVGDLFAVAPQLAEEVTKRKG